MISFNDAIIVYIYTYIYIHKYMHIYIYMRVYVYAYMCACACLCIDKVYRSVMNATLWRHQIETYFALLPLC